MGISRRTLVAAGLAGIPLLSATRLWADKPRDAGPGTQDGSIDAALAAMLMSDGYKQIKVSQYALERSQTEGVRDFARAEIKEHQDLKTRLTGMGFRPMPMATKSVNRTGTEQPSLMTALRLKQELAEECVTMTEQELNRKEPARLERAYVGEQLAAHYMLLESALVFKRHCTPELRAVLDDGQAVIERHINTLKTLMARFDGTAAVPSSRPTGADTVPEGTIAPTAPSAPGTTVTPGTRVTPGTTIPPGTTTPVTPTTPGVGGQGGRPAPRGERR